MDLSHGHFYKTIEEAKTASKHYSTVHYFNRLIRSWRIQKLLFVGIRPPTNKKSVFVGNRPNTAIDNFFLQISIIDNRDCSY